MLEYKIQMIDRTTYFVNDQEQKSYELEFVVMSEESKQKRLQRVQNRIRELKKYRTIEVLVEWKVVKDLSFLTEE